MALPFIASFFLEKLPPIFPYTTYQALMLPGILLIAWSLKTFADQFLTSLRVP